MEDGYRYSISISMGRGRRWSGSATGPVNPGLDIILLLGIIVIVQFVH